MPFLVEIVMRFCSPWIGNTMIRHCEIDERCLINENALRKTKLLVLSNTTHLSSFHSCFPNRKKKKKKRKEIVTFLNVMFYFNKAGPTKQANISLCIIDSLILNNFG